MSIARWVVLSLIFLILIGPASSSTISVPAESVSSYSTVAPDGYVIYEILVGDLPVGTNQSHVLVSNGQTILLSINTWTDSGIWRNVDVTVTYPNGTSQTAHDSVVGALSGNYKTFIQPVIPQLQGATIGPLTVKLDIGLSPVSATLGEAGSVLAYNQVDSAIPFAAASGTLGGITSVYVEEVPKNEYKNLTSEYDPLKGLSNLGTGVFQWTWERVIGFIYMIPIAGPVVVDMLDMMGGVLETGWYWLYFVVSNFPAVLCGVESIILMMAVINAGKGKGSFFRIASNIKKYNVEFGRGVIALFQIVWDWAKGLVEVISAVVQALKPT